MEKSLIERINELARKARQTSLTVDEKAEQQALREEYLKQFRINMRKTLESVTIVDQSENTLIKSKKNEKLN